MSRKSESLFQDKVVKVLNQIPRIKVFKIQQMSKRGDPDLLICANGKFFALELKKDVRSKPTKLQSHILKQVEDAGGFAAVCSPENFDDLINKIKERMYGND